MRPPTFVPGVPAHGRGSNEAVIGDDVERGQWQGGGWEGGFAGNRVAGHLNFALAVAGVEDELAVGEGAVVSDGGAWALAGRRWRRSDDEVDFSGVEGAEERDTLAAEERARDVFAGLLELEIGGAEGAIATGVLSCQ